MEADPYGDGPDDGNPTGDDPDGGKPSEEGKSGEETPDDEIKIVEKQNIDDKAAQEYKKIYNPYERAKS